MRKEDLLDLRHGKAVWLATADDISRYVMVDTDKPANYPYVSIKHVIDFYPLYHLRITEAITYMLIARKAMTERFGDDWPIHKKV